MLVAIGDVYAQIPHRGAVESAMREERERAREEDGCISFAFAEVLDDLGHFLVVESWRDENAREQHYRSPAFEHYQSAVAPLLIRDSEMEVHVVERTLRPVDSQTLSLQHDD